MPSRNEKGVVAGDGPCDGHIPSGVNVDTNGLCLPRKGPDQDQMRAARLEFEHGRSHVH